MKSSKKKPTIDSEGTNQSEEEEKEEEEEDEEEEETETEVNNEEKEAPKLEEGFFEMEAIRKKRVRKGDLQYLIKWRGWPESANTWEPINNLQFCSDFIDAFEERMQKYPGKRKRRGPYSNVNPYSFLNKNRQGSLSEPSNNNPNNEETKSGNDILGDEAGSKDSEGANVSLPNEVKNDETKKEGQEDGLNEEGSSKILQGAKRRKSGSVKRFKPDIVVDSVEGDNGEKSKVDGSVKLPYITKLLKPIEYHASVTNDEQQVSIKFIALRSDGQEVIVDDKELKANNPLVLISYYEQHLRYNPPICDVNEQQG